MANEKQVVTTAKLNKLAKRYSDQLVLANAPGGNRALAEQLRLKIVMVNVLADLLAEK